MMDEAHRICRDIQTSVHDYLDGELQPSSAAVMGEHLRLCPDCARVVQFEAAMKARVRECCTSALAPAELRVRIMARITEAVSGEVVTEVRVTYRESPDDRGR